MSNFDSINFYASGLALRAPWKRSNGFNLIELVVVIAIIGILSAIAVPSFTDTVSSMRTKAAASDLYMALIKARSEAVKRNTKVTLTIVDGKGWKVYPSLAADSILESHTVSGDVSISDGSVEYNSSGRVAANPSFTVTATLGASTSKRCVAIGLSGLPSVKSQSC
jgi:type IV fimbrial biogenesis protein FimT